MYKACLLWRFLEYELRDLNIGLHALQIMYLMSFASSNFVYVLNGYRKCCFRHYWHLGFYVGKVKMSLSFLAEKVVALK